MNADEPAYLFNPDLSALLRTASDTFDFPTRHVMLQLRYLNIERIEFRMDLFQLLGFLVLVILLRPCVLPLF